MVWQLPHEFVAKSVRPASSVGGRCSRVTHLSKSSVASTTTRNSIFACCGPHKTVQLPRYVPGKLGWIHHLFSRPGTSHSFPFSSGTQNPCTTSADPIVILTGRGAPR